ncbi:hypothetical protein ROZALSC1DRAFT_25866, partial [Rozella allomycis CSF55]
VKVIVKEGMVCGKIQTYQAPMNIDLNQMNNQATEMETIKIIQINHQEIVQESFVHLLKLLLELKDVVKSLFKEIVQSVARAKESDERKISSVYLPKYISDENNSKNDCFELEEFSSSLIPKMMHREPKLKDGKVLLQSSLNHDNQNKRLSQLPFGLNKSGKENKMHIEQTYLLKQNITPMQIKRDGNIGNECCISSGKDIPGEKVSGNKIQDDLKHESKK